MTAHVHAALMLLYAQDAATTDKPEKLWEWAWAGETQWKPVNASGPSWLARCNYRRNPERRWYRVALFSRNPESWTGLVSSPDGNEQHTENSPLFVRWLTDRVYYNVK